MRSLDRGSELLRPRNEEGVDEQIGLEGRGKRVNGVLLEEV